jgi:uncharacterized protein (TIGR02453 family)
MAARFAGFSEAMPEFFRQLEKNNNREWFQAHKTVYEESVRAPMEELVEAVNRELATFAPEHVNDPKRAIYRIYRDTRFSNDKTPYKTHMGAIFPRRGLEKHGGAGYYFQVSAQGVGVAGGVYMPGKEDLGIIRNHIAAGYGGFERLVTAKKLTNLLGPLQGEGLSRPPKGFSADQPGIEWIKKKQWYYYIELEPALALGKAVLPEIVKRFQAVRDFLEWMNEPLIARKKQARRDPLLVSPLGR